jgi:CheY-like chemotaxis protein
MDMALTVLLIDDSDLFRTRMRRRLQEEPELTVVEARDGFEGLIAIEKARPDAVLLDLHLPGMDGFTVLGEIRERFDALKVVVLSANLTAASRLRCVELGAEALIDKADAASSVIPALYRALGTPQTEGL